MSFDTSVNVENSSPKISHIVKNWTKLGQVQKRILFKIKTYRI